MSLTRLVTDDWTVQPAQVADVNFIIDTWCADESVHARDSGEDAEVFKVGMRGRILRLLSTYPVSVVRPTAAWFAKNNLKQDRRELFGWICHGQDRATLRPIIHFVYVKADYRNQGLASALLWAAGVRPEHTAWSTNRRVRLRKAMNNRGILYCKYLLDYDPQAKPKKAYER